MAKIKTAKNLVSNRNEYNSYYGDFRGVDFSSDHTQVANNRFAYLVNMYKDYKSANGTAIETIPGFRRMFSLSQDGNEPDMQKIHGIYTLDDKVYVHIGDKFVFWGNFPHTCGIKHAISFVCTEDMHAEDYGYELDFKSLVEQRGGRLGRWSKVFTISCGDDTVLQFEYLDGRLKFFSTSVKVGDAIVVEYAEDTVPSNQLRPVIPDASSCAFQYGRRLLLFTGGKLLCVSPHDPNEPPYTEPIEEFYDPYGITLYIPTTYKGLVQSGDNSNTEYEQRNLLSPYFYNEFYGETKSNQTLVLMSRASDVMSVEEEVYYSDGKAGWESVPYYSFDVATNTVTVNKSFPVHTRIRVRAKYADFSPETFERLASCTKGCLFDNRLFLSGNPDFPNTVYFSTPLDQTNYRISFGSDDWFNDGVNNIPISALIPVGDNLLVIKEGAEEGGSAYLHSKLLTEDNIVTKAYPREQGLQGVGCIGAFTNFYDDPVFVSNLGVSALGQLSVRNERALEHRSTLIDAKLANMDLRKSFFVEWNGYLLLFVEGCIFMADSRQKYVDDLGMVQYEWYYIEGVGTYTGQTKGENGAYEGGVFCPATCARTIQDNVYFGTDGGVVCGFNFDKRNEHGDILPEWYTFDGRTIVSGCATKMDNCGIPHLTKSTVKKSMVIKIKALPASSLKIKVRTNTNPYKQVARIGSKVFSFETMDFDEFSFLTSDSGLFSVKEKEKKWVEKQVYLCSDEHMRPFALYYMAYRYFVAGRYKG